MSRVGPEAAEIQPPGLLVGPEALGEEPYAEDRVGHGFVGELVGRDRIARGFAGVKEGLQVDQDRVFTGRYEVLEVEVRRIERVEERQVPPLAPVETADLVRRRAGLLGHELHPSVGPAVEDLERPERRVVPPLVQPGEEFLEVDVDRQAPWLVDDPKTRTELGDLHRPAAAMRVA